MGMRDFRQLKVWQRSHELALETYAVSKRFPSDELYGVTSQILRASTSIPTNIAEGCGCHSEAEFQRFLQIAMRSASEVDYLLLFARDTGLLPLEDYAALSNTVIEVKKVLSSLISRVRQR